jgi:ribosomal protein S27E
MRVRTNCDNCGQVAVQPHHITVLRSGGPDSEGLFECPVCTRVMTTPVGKHALSVLVARGATETTPATDAHAPISLADLRQFQALLDDDEACLQLLGGTT